MYNQWKVVSNCTSFASESVAGEVYIAHYGTICVHQDANYL